MLPTGTSSRDTTRRTTKLEILWSRGQAECPQLLDGHPSPARTAPMRKPVAIREYLARDVLRRTSSAPLASLVARQRPPSGPHKPVPPSATRCATPFNTSSHNSRRGIRHPLWTLSQAGSRPTRLSVRRQAWTALWPWTHGFRKGLPKSTPLTTNILAQRSFPRRTRGSTAWMTSCQ